jgi:hypothetical protein
MAGACHKALAALLAGLALSLAAAGAASAQDIPPPKTLTYKEGWTRCTGENGWCQFYGGIRDVAYGANGRYIYLLAVQDNVYCNNGNFWDNDPIRGVTKACWVSNGKSRLATAQVCAAEGGTCNITGSGTVWYGGAGQFVPRQVDVTDANQVTAVGCNSGVFGDPNRGQPKYCLVTP